MERLYREGATELLGNLPEKGRMGTNG